MCRLIRVPFVSAAKFMFLFYVPVTHILHNCYIRKTLYATDCQTFVVPTGVSCICVLNLNVGGLIGKGNGMS